jgi:hypothetical protein
MPLKRTVLCLDCEMCFGIGSTNCPACGSESWVALNRFLLGAPAKRRLNIVRHASNRLQVTHDTAILLIIGRDQPGLYEKLKAAFAGESNARVILDRRRGDRRSNGQGTTLERRRADRRTRPAVDSRVRALGWAAVRLGAEKGSGSRSRLHHQNARAT